MIFKRKKQQESGVNRISPRKNKRLKIFFWTITILIIGIVSWIGTTGIIAFQNITTKNDTDGPSFFKTGQTIDPTSLTEGGSRINTLIIGADSAAGLTDTLQIYSIDPINNTLSIISVPRDLYVANPLGGKSKINEVYNAGKKKCQIDRNCDKDIDNGAVALKSVLKTVLNVDVHYFAKVDFQGFKNIIDSVGGVTIYVEKALSDPGFPCDYDPGTPCGYYQKAGTFNMNGTQALRYARCRNGNCGNDFGRAARQQQVIQAIKDKVLSLGVITNPQKVTNIISTLGTHFKTDMKLDEMIRIFKIIQGTDNTKTKNGILSNDTDDPLRSYNNGQYILIPKAGENDWGGVHEYVLSIMPEPYIIKEAANIAIVDASGKDLAEDVKEILENVGYTVVSIEDAAKTASQTNIWQNGDKPYTFELLKKRTDGVKVTKIPSSSAIDPHIVLVIGTDYVIE